MALWANSTESFFLFGAKEEDAISDFYGILSVENVSRKCRKRGIHSGHDARWFKSTKDFSMCAAFIF